MIIVGSDLVAGNEAEKRTPEAFKTSQYEIMANNR
jgi:hypothetical protein